MIQPDQPQLIMESYFAVNLLLLALFTALPTVCSANLTISTECGPVEAIKSALFDDVWVFHGVPFGGSTAGVCPFVLNPRC